MNGNKPNTFEYIIKINKEIIIFIDPITNLLSMIFENSIYKVLINNLNENENLFLYKKKLIGNKSIIIEIISQFNGINNEEEGSNEENKLFIIIIE